jgi:hypothetical protein
VRPAVGDAIPAPVTVDHDGYRIAARVAVNDDLDALIPGRGLEQLLERCLLDAHDASGRPVTAAELPPAAAQATATAMAEADPGAETSLRLHCPCGHGWEDELDIRTTVWHELSDWVGRTLTDVHQLAAAYGWSEAESLSIPAWRRRWYLEAAGA